ncbi:MAG: helical backbone metal receptor [Deltaproteobacteria bacterium]|nr:helical backbone metal receptor [Deltaproteobacteria bacterium]
MAPSLTEVLIALGAADRIVGVSRYDEFPEVAKVTRIGGYVDPDLETILGLRPDLVVAEPSPGNERVVRKLASLGIPVRVVHGASLAELRLQVEALARDLGRPEAGVRLLETLEERRLRVQLALAGAAPRRALLVVGHEPLVVAAPGSLAHELLELSGATNVVPPSASPYPVYALEAAIAAEPEVVLDFSGRPLSERPASLATLGAVKAGRWVQLADTSLLRPGPEVMHAVEVMARRLHPGRFPRPRAPEGEQP